MTTAKRRTKRKNYPPEVARLAHATWMLLHYQRHDFTCRTTVTQPAAGRRGYSPPCTCGLRDVAILAKNAVEAVVGPLELDEDFEP